MSAREKADLSRRRKNQTITPRFRQIGNGVSFYFIPLKNALPSLEKEFFEKTLPSRVAGVFQKAIREMELHQRAIQGFDIFQCGILGIAGTASVVHRGLREEIHVLVFDDGF